MRSTLTLRDQRYALRLLREAAGAIADELQAAGPEDTQDHAILRGHGRIHDRVLRFLARIELPR